MYRAMNPSIEHIQEKDDTLTFTLTGVDVCYANALRRTILSHISAVMIDTSDHILFTNNNPNNNSSRLHNEILKERLSNIPVHIKPAQSGVSDEPDDAFKHYVLIIDVENKTDTMMIVTSEDFQIWDEQKEQLLSKAEVKKIFPPFTPLTKSNEYYIEFARLRPRVSAEIPGEHIQCKARFMLTSPIQFPTCRVACTVGMAHSPDHVQMKEELPKLQQIWKEEEKNVVFETKNWNLLDGKRLTIPHSFDFKIESVGVYTNEEIVYIACQTLIDQMDGFKTKLEDDELDIRVSNVTEIPYAFDIVLHEKYTIGNMLKTILFNQFLEKTEQLTYCGYMVAHPHDTFGTLRLAFKDGNNGKSDVKVMLKAGLDGASKVFDLIKMKFNVKR